MFYKTISICLLLSSACKAEVIIFDLFGVLFTITLTDKIKFMGTLPIEYAAKDKKNPMDIQHIFLDVLEKLPVPGNHDVSQNNALIVSGKRMSDIMYLWQANKINHERALNLTLDHIAVLSKQNYFCSEREQQLIIKAAHAAFHLQTRKTMWKTIEQGIEILHRCAAMTDSNGQRKHKIYVLSNMDPEMLEHLQITHPALFKLFDGIVTSGETGFLKPDMKIYEKIISKFNIEPQKAIFIDDQEENIKGAQKLGIRGILCTNFSSVRDQLVKLGIILPKKLFSKAVIALEAQKNSSLKASELVKKIVESELALYISLNHLQVIVLAYLIESV